jgi:hypothetical protein
MSLLAFLKRFPYDDACWVHLETVRWPQGPICPACGSIGDAYVQCREQADRAAIIDNQSVKSAEKGGAGLMRRALMVARRSRAEQPKVPPA